MRYERKFQFYHHELDMIELHLRKNGFYESYPKRDVNSIYYDTNEFTLFNFSEDGISNRLKKRIRWYDDSTESQLEYKIKFAELGIKKLNKNIKDNQCCQIKIVNQDYSEIYEKKIPKSLNNIFFPKVGVNYQRKYFISASKNIRITIDYNIKFARIFENENNYRIENWIPFQSSVLEIKYNYLINNASLEINKFLSKFNLHLIRSSKYCIAVKYFY